MSCRFHLRAQLVGFQEEVQLREQDWGNFQVWLT
jgi:hypothetical protein